ncbi:2742_t:CDS:2, partial [Scutellospora calospora]
FFDYKPGHNNRTFHIQNHPHPQVFPNLKLDDEDLAIFLKEKITGLDFIETTEEKFRSYGLRGLAIFIVELKKLNVFDRYCENKEKIADTSLVSEGVKVIAKANNPSTLTLITGNGDYGPLIVKALNGRLKYGFGHQ